MASAFTMTVEAEIATLLHTAGHHGAKLFFRNVGVLVGGSDVDASHGISVGDQQTLTLGPDESLYAWSSTAGASVQVLVTNDV